MLPKYMHQLLSLGFALFSAQHSFAAPSFLEKRDVIGEDISPAFWKRNLLDVRDVDDERQRKSLHFKL